MTSPDPVVRIPGWRWRLVPWMVVGGAAGIALTAATVRWVFRAPLGPLPFALGVVVLGGLAVYAAHAFRRDGIREVVLSTAGVTFVLGRESIEVAWAKLEPPKHRLFFGEIGIPFPKDYGPKSTDVESRRGYVLVTRRQAIAILRHPSCPTWPLTNAIRSSLGLSRSPPRETNTAP